MKTQFIRALTALAFCASLHQAAAQGTAFTYQGQLENNGGPANGEYNLTFTLYTNSTGGLAVAGPVATNGVLITNGLFTVLVDFGAGVFTGTSNWLQIAVETNGGASFSTLTPRQQLTPTPYAIYAENAASVGGIAPMNFWQLGGNAGTTPGADFLGTTDNEALELKVNGANAMLLQPAAANTVNVAVGPFSGVGLGLSGVTIAGGGNSGGPNLAYENWSTISGGFDQQILSGSSGAVIAGGQSQRILTGSGQAAIGGGYNNIIGPGATGGTIPGGWNNLVSGIYGFAAGNTAQATNSGAFVWADDSGGAFASTANNQFSARALGGVRFVTGGAGMTIDGQPVATGSGWSLTGNNGAGAVLGTTNNYPLQFVVNGANAMLLQPAAANTVNVAVGPFSGVGLGLSGVTIAGGGNSGGPNLAYENWSTISGGFDQQILSGSSGAVIAGGQSQRILTGSGQAAIGGGYNNIIGPGATGGTIPGGWNNLVSGIYGFAAGNTAQATNSGAFVWADDSGGAFASTANNQFSARALGGVRFVTGGAGMTIDGQPVATGTGWGLTGNAGTSYGTDFMGTTDNEPLELKVNGVVAETLWPIASGNPSVALGPNSYFYLYGQGGSFVGPGGAYGANINVTYGDFCVIGGGFDNKIYAVGADYSVISGGNANYLTSEEAVIGGGYDNTNAGDYATIPGGANNSVSAAGTYGFAAGDNAAVANLGSFVWSDGSGTPTVSTADNSVTFRASGGYRLFTGTGSSGAQLLAGGTSWTTISDRNAKKNIQPVDAVSVLDKLAAVPIEQWNYKWEKDNDVPNIGPMAQDFKKAFYPGRDEKGISTLEFDGVELAAIQGLNQKLEQQARQKDAEITSLKQLNDALAQRLSDLEATVKKLAEPK